MNPNCVICSDILDEINPISAAPCGHVYHARCLFQWVDQSQTCPQCRFRIDLRCIRKLYFNFVSDSDISSLQNEISILRTQLSAMDEEMEAIKEEREGVLSFFREAEQKTNNMKQSLHRVQNELQNLRSKSKMVSKLEAKVLQLERKNKVFSNELEFYKDIQKLISGTEADVEILLSKHNDHSKASKELATYCVCLKRVVDSKHKLIDSSSKLKCKNSAYVTEINFYEDALEVPNTFYQKSTATDSASPLILGEKFFVNVASASTASNVHENRMRSPLSIRFGENNFNICVEASNVHKTEFSCENVKVTSTTTRRKINR